MNEDDPIDRRTGMKRIGAVALGSVALAGCSGAGEGDGNGNTDGDDSSDFGGWMEDAKNYDGGVVDETGADRVTVEVGVGTDGFAFGPSAIRVSTGTEVQWKWTGEGGQHNVEATEGEDFESDLYDESGVNFSHTFENSGTVKYECNPHSGVGMRGVVVVE